MLAISGCKTGPHRSVALNDVPRLDDIRAAVQKGQFYRARVMTLQVIESGRNVQEAESLMAEILDQEIAREKEVYEDKSIEELSSAEKRSAEKIWLDRAETMLALRQYEQAILAAEKVFLYDPDNTKASRLIDRIRRHAAQEGKIGSELTKKSANDDLKERVDRYRNQAKLWIQQQRWGSAKLAVEKILLLVPEDEEALRLYENIKAHTQD
ncbi:MAG: hypothetical protein NC930_06235 [Candidatus Omnitrophica bacterium]|nr:hypothetical protein [Candidatus Omnitrophota bacterium]